METVDKDAAFSWKAATLIMLFFSLFSLTMTLFAMNPFSLLFNVALVHLPTVLLLGSTLFDRSKISS